MLLCKNFVIDWTPKAGCTITKKIWFDYMNVLDEALEFEHDHDGVIVKGWVHDFEPTFKERCGEVTQFQLNSPNFIKIKYVRNPYDRVVSSYIHGCKWPRLFGNCHDHDPSFYEFLTLLTNTKLNMFAGGGHWRIQNIFPDINYNEVVKLEQLEDDVVRLNKKYNLNLKSDFDSDHHVKKKNKIDKFFNVSASDVKKHLDENEEVPTYDSFYNDEITEMVYEIYKTDIETYGYEN
jgi:hypothetical protein